MATKRDDHLIETQYNGRNDLNTMVDYAEEGGFPKSPRPSWVRVRW